MKKKQDKYSIDIYNLKDGKHLFELNCDSDLLNNFDSDLAENIEMDVDIQLDKYPTNIELKGSIKGSAKLLCDRSLEAFDYPIETDFKVFYKFGDHYEEQSEELFIIPLNQMSLDLSQLLYDAIAISIPARKIHPDYLDEEDEEEDGPYFSTESEEDEESSDEKTNPLWEQLKKLK